MKKILIIFGLILSMTSLAYATMFCCPPEKTKEQCCAERGKLYCENDGKCGRDVNVRWMNAVAVS
ncbi:MAG: hypothetical protein J6U64_03515, partial [Alphaproteobacteria bacterium]|nr:hypothetical protein [Alphaproteobacteria bacterium]